MNPETNALLNQMLRVHLYAVYTGSTILIGAIVWGIALITMEKIKENRKK